MIDLPGKTALVTGAASGIGAAIARCFAQAGARVFVADLDAPGGRAVAEQIAAGGGRAEFVPVDVSQETSCRDAMETVMRAHPDGLDALVNCAGIGHVGTILQTESADLDRLWAVNVKGVFFLSRLFLPPMLARRAGSIVNIASIGGVVGVRDRLAYCATKFAVVGITKCMALDHAQAGVRVNCICPGRVETPFVQARLREYPDPERAYREMSASQPLGRMARPEEIASAALYLASDAAAFVTGSALVIDGGFSAGR
jgi:NAD(P)-dependent dehydrogenase (short-subunit alcohol dehydrogenase family)